MAIYRGLGGSGDSENDATISVVTTLATNAANSASDAADSEAAAASSAASASNSAAAAFAFSNSANTSSGSAFTSATNAAAIFNAFDAIYLGSKASDPLVDNEGNPLNVGAQYFNTASDEIRVYNGSTWQTASIVGGIVTSLNVTGETTLAGASTTDNINFGDNNKAVFGDGTDLEIYHDGTNSYIEDVGTGTLRIRSSGLFLQPPGGFANMASFINGGAVNLFYNGFDKLNTTNTGINVTGTVVADGLTVDGVTQLISTTGSANLYLDSQFSSGRQYSLSSTSGGDFRISDGEANTERLRIDSSGNLGLGVTPSAWWSTAKALQVKGASMLSTGNTNSLTANAFLNNTPEWCYINTAPATHYEQTLGQHRWFTAPSGTAGNAISFTQAMTLDASGRLGIGTSSPTNALSVAGNANITGNTTLGDASTDTVTVNGYMGVGGNAISSAAIYVRNTALSGTTQVGVNSNFTGSSGSTSSIRAFSAGAKTEAASFTTSDVVSFYANNATKGAGSTITNQHGLYIADQTQGTNNYGITSLVSSGTNKWNIYASGTAANYFAGNVGIKTTSTSAALNIFGQIEFSGTTQGLIFSSTSRLLAGSTYGDIRILDDRFRLYDGAGTNIRLNATTTEFVVNETGNDYDFRVESDTNTHALFLRGSDGNVGIGTSSPAAQLDIASGFTSTLRLSNTDTLLSLGQITGEISFYQSDTSGGGTGVSGRIGMRSANRPDTGTYFGNSADMAFYVSGSSTGSASADATYEALTLRSDGNVGIGTSSPAGKLEVVTGSGAAWFTRSASNIGTSAPAFGILTSGTTTQIRSYGDLQFYATTVGGSISEKMRIDSSGNLGLGVTPSAWGGAIKALQIGSYGVINQTSNVFNIGSNYYSNGTNALYLNSTLATLYQQASGEHRFFTAPSGTAGDAITFTQAMTLDASGNLGIGTSSPGAKLQVNTSSATGTEVAARFASSTDAAGVKIERSGSSWRLASQANLHLGADYDANSSGTDSNIIFEVDATERMRIDSSGNLLVGQTTQGGSGKVCIGFSGATNWGIQLNTTSASNGDQFATFRSAGTTIGSITQATSTTVSYNTSSDYRLKDITGPITTSGAYIDSLNPVEGTWKADGSTFVGLIAHEVQEASRTQVATGVKDGEEMQGMDYSSAEIIANLIAEVKALRTRVAALESI